MNWKHVHNFRQKPVPQPISLRRNYRLPIKRLPRKSIIHTQCISVASVLERVNACTANFQMHFKTLYRPCCWNYMVRTTIHCFEPFEKVNRRKNKHFKKTRKKKRVRKLENKKKLLEKERECAAKTVVKL